METLSTIGPSSSGAAAPSASTNRRTESAAPLRTIRPLDEETILASVRRTGKCLVVHEDNRFGGFGAEVAALVAEQAFDYLDGPVTRLAGPESPASPNALSLEEAFMLSPSKIAAAIRTLAAY
jgi:2-oxoisovalerate dehydrogenase E1 component beta subunit